MLNYILALLVVLVLSLGAATYGYKTKADRLGDEVATLTKEVKDWQDKTQEAIDREVLANTRCTISQQTVETVTTVNTTLEESKNLTLRELAKQPHDKLLETIINANQKPITVADDARLSADAMRLLNSAYCAGAKNDSACPTIGTPDKLPTSKSGK